MDTMLPEDLLQTLSAREKEVLALICQHKEYQEIADEFVISKNTVKSHMSRIYKKLGLTYLKRDERIIAIHTIYCPLIDKKTKSKKRKQKIEIIDITPEPEPLSPEEEEIIDGDEMALVAYKQEPITGGKKKVGTKKKRGCAKFIFTLILGGLMVVGTWYTWNNYVKDIPIVQSIVQLINPDAVIESSPTAPSSSSPSNTSSSDSSSSESESILEKILPETNPYADAYEMGDWAKQDDVWVRLFDFEVSQDYIRIDFEIWNKTGKDIYFSWSPEQNFSMTDNNDNRYEIFTTSTREVSVENDERLHFTGHGYDTIQFRDDPIFESGVTDLYITMEYLSKIDKAIFHVSVGN